MTLTFIQDGSIMSSANYIRALDQSLKKKSSVSEGDMEQKRNHYMKYTDIQYNYIKIGRKITVPFLYTSSNDALYLYKAS